MSLFGGLDRRRVFFEAAVRILVDASEEGRAPDFAKYTKRAIEELLFLQDQLLELLFRVYWERSTPSQFELLLVETLTPTPEQREWLQTQIDDNERIRSMWSRGMICAPLVPSPFPHRVRWTMDTR